MNFACNNKRNESYVRKQTIRIRQKYETVGAWSQKKSVFGYCQLPFVIGFLLSNKTAFHDLSISVSYYKHVWYVI